MRNLLLLSILLLFCVSCARNHNTNEKLVINIAKNLTPTDVNPDFLLNEIFESITFTQLADDTINGLKYPLLIDVNEKYICFNDAENKQVVSVYDRLGQCVISLNKNGKGRGEYIEPRSVYYEESGEVSVLAYKERKLYKYSSDGLLKSAIETPAIDEARYIGDGKYLCRSYATTADKLGNSLLSIMDSTGRVTEQLMPVEATIENLIHSPSDFVRGDGGYNFAIVTIANSGYYNYNIAENKLTELFKFDFGEYALNSDVISGKVHYEEKIIIFKPVKIGNYLYARYISGTCFYLCFWDLRDGKLIARRIMDLNDRSASTYFHYRLPNGELLKLNLYDLFVNNDEFITSDSPSQLKGLDNIDPEGCLVIITLKLKES